MTVRIPKWLLWSLLGLLVVGVVATAFLLGQSSGNDNAADPEATTTAEQVAEAQEAPCTEQAAQEATLSAGFDQVLQDISAANGKLSYYPVPDPPGSNGSPFFDDAGFRIDQIECRDLTGDGVNEMLVSLNAGASGQVFNWMIFEPTAEGEWELAFARSGVQVDRLRVRGDVVVEREPAYVEGEPACCPSGNRTTEVAYRRGKFTVISPAVSPGERLLDVTESGVKRIGEFDPHTGDVGQATVVFGLPSSTTSSGESCQLSWADLGLTISFANLGGGDPCTDGAVGSVQISGPPGRQAGWHTNEGAQVGMGVGSLRRIYPQAARRRGALWLITMLSPYGTGGATPALSAYAGGGKAWIFQLYVGAAGE